MKQMFITITVTAMSFFVETDSFSRNIPGTTKISQMAIFHDVRISGKLHYQIVKKNKRMFLSLKQLGFAKNVGLRLSFLSTLSLKKYLSVSKERLK